MVSEKNPVRPFKLTHGTHHYTDPETRQRLIARAGERVLFTQSQAKAYSDMIVPWRDDPEVSIESEFDGAEGDENDEVEPDE